MNIPLENILKKFHGWSIGFFNKLFKTGMHDYGPDIKLAIVKAYFDNSKGPLLDAACGFDNRYLRQLDIGQMVTVGMDIDRNVKKKNKLHNDFVVGDLHYVRPDQRFELIFSLNTWEHLHTPQLVMKNFYEILVENGILIIIAPQRLHYLPSVERLLPDFMKHWAWQVLKGKGHKQMPYPAFYNLCTKQALLSEASRMGFKVEHFSSLEEPPGWFTRIPPIFVALCFWQLLVNKYDVFENFRSSFTLVLKKENGIDIKKGEM